METSCLWNDTCPRIAYLITTEAAQARSQELAYLCEGRTPAPGEEWSAELPGGQIVQLELFTEHEAMVERLEKRRVDAVLLDNRTVEPISAFSDTLAGRALPELLAMSALGRKLARRSVFVILPEAATTPHHAYAVGSLQLGGILLAPMPLERALAAVVRTVRPKDPGKVALCCAGGGIEGMLYELGVGLALDERLVNRSITDFDIFSGISAGAIFCAFLANGIRPSEMVEIVHGRTSRLEPLSRAVLFDPNVTELLSRGWAAAGDLLKGKFLSQPIEAAMKILPNGAFAGDKLRWYLERQLTKPGLTNDFDQLKKELYIGTTDQDTGEHITFGEEGLRDVPISHAVRASAAMTPYYPPEQLKGRYYIDGIFTRTINLDVAVASGARLIICIDPLRPVQVDEAGYVSDRGGFFNSVQSVKSMIRTRFSELRSRAEEAYPDVTVFEFSPSAKDMEHMSGTMMRFFYSPQTIDLAYRSASEIIDRDYEYLSSALRSHGFELRRP
ncbi:MAG: patatin-like phospholipase family protein [Myxococcota bacterium]|nr:patatin-like phospholipase family protein [Myxococcota bacterium]